MIVDTRLKADSVRYALFRGDRLLDRGAAMRRDQSGRSWVIELGQGESVSRARDLDLDVSYAQGRVSSSIRLQRITTVPRIVGLAESGADCRLERRGLRWRLKGDDRVQSRPRVPCHGGSTVIPDPRVLRQRPSPGTPVKQSTVVVIDNECTARSDSAGKRD